MEPFGEERADLRAAIVASTVYNCLRGEKDDAKPVEDFMPEFEAQPGPEVGQADLVAGQLAAIATAFGAKHV